MIIDTVRGGQSFTAYLPEWKVISFFTEGTCIVSRYEDPSNSLERKSFTNRVSFGPYPQGYGFRLDALSSKCEVSIDDPVDNKVLTGPVIQDSPLAISNQLINVLPTQVARPYDNAEVQQYSSASSSVSLGDDKYDPSSGLAMAKATIPANDTAWHEVNYFAVGEIGMNPFDTWMFSVYVPERKTSTLQIEIVLSSDETIGGNTRSFRFHTTSVQRGYNLFTLLHGETKNGSTEYGVFNTNIRSTFNNSGTMDVSSIVKSIRVRCRNTSPGDAAPTDVYFGSVFTAPEGWAKGAICWYGDDVGEEFVDLAGPIIERYGWNYGLAVTSSYAGDPTRFGHSSMEDIKKSQAKGHEIHGHTRAHEDMEAEDTAGKTKAIVQANAYFRGQGIDSASRFMAWPFGRYDDEAISICKSNDMILSATVVGDQTNPFMAGVNPFYLNRFSIEQVNSWHIDTQIHGCALRGTMMWAYGHRAVKGGADTDVRPAENRFYTDHLIRWCELAKSYEEQGKLVVTTPLRYYKLCGLDPYTAKFLE